MCYGELKYRNKYRETNECLNKISNNYYLLDQEYQNVCKRMEEAMDYINVFYERNEETIEAFGFEYSYKHILEILKGDRNE